MSSLPILSPVFKKLPLNKPGMFNPKVLSKSKTCCSQLTNSFKARFCLFTSVPPPTPPPPHPPTHVYGVHCVTGLKKDVSEVPNTAHSLLSIFTFLRFYHIVYPGLIYLHLCQSTLHITGIVNVSLNCTNFTVNIYWPKLSWMQMTEHSFKKKEKRKKWTVFKSKKKKLYL